MGWGGWRISNRKLTHACFAWYDCHNGRRSFDRIATALQHRCPLPLHPRTSPRRQQTARKSFAGGSSVKSQALALLSEVHRRTFEAAPAALQNGRDSRMCLASRVGGSGLILSRPPRTGGARPPRRHTLENGTSKPWRGMIPLAIKGVAAPLRLTEFQPVYRRPQDAPSALEWGKSSQLAEDAWQARVNAYYQHQLKRGIVSGVPRLTDLAAELLGAGKETDFDDIPAVILENNLWKNWTRIPYAIFRRVCVKICESNDAKIDEWILCNEKWLRDRGSDTPWQRGLVNLKWVEPIFPGSIRTRFGRTIARPENLSGLELLCDARTSQVTIQASTKAFKQTFQSMSDGILLNLNWSNVLVAGGIALGTLLSVDAPNDAEIHHIYETLRSNVNGRPTLAVRNAKTITFYVDYPIRRIQVILKLAQTPKDVLLNFDLDICAIGWDGRNLWMLPRAARALESVSVLQLRELLSETAAPPAGCNVFTMHLIRGHYLSERRASQPKRIFKYASKGYGLRILPSYLKSLTRSPENIEATFPAEDLLNLDINVVVSDARAWVEAVFLRMVGKKVHYYDMEEGPLRRSCLTLFPLFMRNVAYWEIRRKESEDPRLWPMLRTKIQYKWNNSFRLEAFKDFIKQSNRREVQAWIDTDFGARLRDYGVIHGDELEAVQRLTYASRIEVLLDSDHDPKVPVLLPCDFAAYANALVKSIQAEAQLPEAPILQPVVSYASTGDANDPRSGLYIWSIAAELMWQHADRRIDELFEILQAFRRANATVNTDLQAERFFEELSKRDSQTHTEFDAFFRWIMQQSAYAGTPDDVTTVGYNGSERQSRRLLSLGFFKTRAVNLTILGKTSIRTGPCEIFPLANSQIYCKRVVLVLYSVWIVLDSGRCVGPLAVLLTSFYLVRRSRPTLTGALTTLEVLSWEVIHSFVALRNLSTREFAGRQTRPALVRQTMFPFNGSERQSRRLLSLGFLKTGALTTFEALS
ncbi:hypothetical protein B0H12DRAFT_1079753 [Mycena haematopus]|nr:hypothetical protein B0H12DRAFT_1079753 [Mycena haematopus]